MAPHKKYSALGRGLDALISTDEPTTQGSSSINEIAIDNIMPNPDQPRRAFDEEALRELADSIREIGIIQPVTLRQTADGTYQIIAGERRWRAARMAGLSTLPAYIRTATDEKVREMALIENIQREDLNAIEIALAYNNLITEFQLTQEQLSEKVGKKRATVANYLRLLNLPAEIQLALRNRTIDQGHARPLLSLGSPALQLKVFGELQKNDYSVREVEEMVQRLTAGESLKETKQHMKEKAELPACYAKTQSLLAERLGANVKLSVSKSGKGRITIPFNSADDLERLLRTIDTNI